MRSASPQLSEQPTAPAWLTGLWQRREILLPDGTADRTTRVFWGQTPSLYVDLRVPADRPPGAGRRSFADFAPDELLQLTEQKGFAGHITLDGSLCRWTRYLDYRPNNGRPDEGHLRLDGDRLYEEGDPTSVLGSAYRETYERIARGDRRSVALRAEGSREGVLVILDDHFLYARARQAALPPAETLRELIESADRALVERYLDCEISSGTVDGWIVSLSTVPFREGRRLGLAAARLAGDAIAAEGRAGSERWRIVDSSLDRDALVALLNA